ncbi:MAG: monovalent cation/H+ antiporter subunit D [Pseudomonadota bacterium]|nr:monovalent cation/H+ antiporter subunit D [Pseudomonadota bacterium]
MTWSDHLPVLPVLLPLLTAAVLLLLERRGIGVQRAVSTLGLLALLAVSVLLVIQADRGDTLVYLLGDWPARLGIALVADRLSALLVLTTALLAAACLLHACSGWDRRALHFHALFQLQLVGLNGAFLTGDLFNLFVFFEVLLIASYGLLLAGGHGPRMRAGLHYVAVNIAASTVFLLALGLLYGVTGTLNMAEMALRVAAAAPADIALIRAGAGLLLVVFCTKAALVPLYLWLPLAYSRAPAAVAALFVVMTKVGVYAALRVYTLVFGSEAGVLAGWAWPWLLWGGILTLVLATLGALAAPTLRALAAYLVVASAATLFIAVALATPDAVAAGLYYLVHSTFVTAALFLVADMVRRAHLRARHGDGQVVLASLSVPGLLFLVAAVSVSGLPPLSGFLGKLLLLAAVPPAQVFWVWSAILVTSLLTVVALARAGGRVFWEGEYGATPSPLQPGEAEPPPAAEVLLPVHTPAQLAATLLLLGYGVALTLGAAPAQRYAQAAAEQVLSPLATIEAVRGTQPQLRAPSP